VITAAIAAASTESDSSFASALLNRIVALFAIGEPGSPERTAAHVVLALLFGLLLFIDLTPLILKFARGSTAHDDAYRTANPLPASQFNPDKFASPVIASRMLEAALEQVDEEIASQRARRAAQRQAAQPSAPPTRSADCG
jgi:hypothetical protein